jgi:murein DD-endopeptidase MepM/ murein hydrolase activator NlpD
MGMYMHVHAVAPQSAAESDRIAFAVSNYIQLDTLQPASEASDFSTVAFAGQNVGGLPTNEAAIRQYVVQDKDTLSSIASKYSLHSGSLVLANKGTLDNTELIHPGQVLFIPDTDAAAKDLAAELTSRQQKKLAATKVASTATAKVESVKKTSSTTLAETSSADITLGQPLAYYTYISQGFNALTHPGFDFATDSGTPVFAVSKGCVETASYGYNGGYGNTLVYSMTHTNYTFRYAHLSKLLASEGDCFEQGDLLGYSGNSGRSTGPHLHFEVRYNGTAVNPGKFKL